MADVKELKITVCVPKTPKLNRLLAKNMVREDGALALLLVSPPPAPDFKSVVSRLSVIANYFEQAGWTPPPGYESAEE